jgi:DnaJ like chaperone protein
MRPTLYYCQRKKIERVGMSIWGKVGTAAANVSIGGPIGKLLGGIAGRDTGGRDQGHVLAEDEVVFTVSVVALGAKMAKADGVVTADEVNAFKDVFKVPKSEPNNVTRMFNLSRQYVAGYEAYAEQLSALFKGNRKLLENVLDGLFHIAWADNRLGPREEKFLADVAKRFGFTDTEFVCIKARHLIAEERDPYHVLGVAPSISNDELKRHYRRLVVSNHPDKVMARGVPKEFIAIATKKLAAINEAFDAIAKERGVALRRRTRGRAPPSRSKLATEGSGRITVAETTPEAGATIYSIRKVPFDAPYNWLAAGWRDMGRVPRVSLAYGAVFALAGLLLAVGLTRVGLLSLIIVLAAGFILIGPMLAAGLYETSRRLEKSEPVSLADTLRSGFLRGNQLPFMGLFLMLIYLAWVEIALLLFMLFFGPQPIPPLEAFVPTLLLTPRGLGLLIVGAVVGLALAATVFAVSAVAVPLLMVERVDVVTAALTSMKACRTNPKAMALWAALIAGAMLFGFVTLFLGLVIMFPLIGHATWHAFRDLIDDTV